MNPIFRWSFSQWETYNQCPAKWKYQYVMRLPRSTAPAAARGTIIHESVESYIKGEFVSDEYVHPAVKRKFIPILDEFKDHPNGARYTEFKLALDFDWNLVPESHPSASCVMVLDAVRVGGAWQGPDKGEDDGLVRIGEWKSGSPKDTHPDQRKMYAMAGFAQWNAKSVEVTTYYLEDTAPPARLTVADTAYDRLKAFWTERRDLMIRDEICAPRAGFYCKWCDYAKTKGGPCHLG
jgi:hypothetical protein